MRDCPDGQTFIKYLNGPGGTCVKDVWGDSGNDGSNGSGNSNGSSALSASQMRQRETLALAGLGLAFFFLLALLS